MSRKFLLFVLSAGLTLFVPSMVSAVVSCRPYFVPAPNPVPKQFRDTLTPGNIVIESPTSLRETSPIEGLEFTEEETAEFRRLQESDTRSYRALSVGLIFETLDAQTVWYSKILQKQLDPLNRTLQELVDMLTGAGLDGEDIRALISCMLYNTHQQFPEGSVISRVVEMGRSRLAKARKNYALALEAALDHLALYSYTLSRFHNAIDPENRARAHRNQRTGTMNIASQWLSLNGVAVTPYPDGAIYDDEGRPPGLRFMPAKTSLGRVAKALEARGCAVVVDPDETGTSGGHFNPGRHDVGKHLTIGNSVLASLKIGEIGLHELRHFFLDSLIERGIPSLLFGGLTANERGGKRVPLLGPNTASHEVDSYAEYLSLEELNTHTYDLLRARKKTLLSIRELDPRNEVSVFKMKARMVRVFEKAAVVQSVYQRTYLTLDHMLAGLRAIRRDWKSREGMVMNVLSSQRGMSEEFSEFPAPGTRELFADGESVAQVGTHVAELASGQKYSVVHVSHSVYDLTLEFVDPELIAMSERLSQWPEGRDPAVYKNSADFELLLMTVEKRILEIQNIIRERIGVVDTLRQTAWKYLDSGALKHLKKIEQTYPKLRPVPSRYRISK